MCASELPSIVPVERAKVYDVRKVIAAIADRDSVFEIKARYGRAVATSLIRAAWNVGKRVAARISPAKSRCMALGMP